jgi:hypothetical protein
MLRRSLAWVLLLTLVASLAEARMPLTTPGADAYGSPAVYVTKTGKKYHRATCRHLDQSKRKTTKAQAKKDGLTACKVCNPD